MTHTATTNTSTLGVNIQSVTQNASNTTECRRYSVSNASNIRRSTTLCNNTNIRTDSDVLNNNHHHNNNVINSRIDWRCVGVGDSMRSNHRSRQQQQQNIINENLINNDMKSFNEIRSKQIRLMTSSIAPNQDVVESWTKLENEQQNDCHRRGDGATDRNKDENDCCDDASNVDDKSSILTSNRRNM